MNRFGRGTLDKADFRSNSMPYYLPFAVIFGWLSLYLAASNLTENLTSRLPDWQQKLVAYSIFVGIEIVVIVFILASVKRHFDRGLYGFGLRFKEVFGDITSAAAMFIAVWPLVMGAIFLVIKIGTILEGPDFQIQQNEGLAVILENKAMESCDF